MDENTPIVDMSDAELGALTRRLMELFVNSDDQEGIKRIGGTAAALYLVSLAETSEANMLTIDIGAAHIKDRQIGDWKITIIPSDYVRSEEAPITLTGWLKPGRTMDAIDCFEKLTRLRISSDEVK